MTKRRIVRQSYDYCFAAAERNRALRLDIPPGDGLRPPCIEYTIGVDCGTDADQRQNAHSTTALDPHSWADPNLIRSIIRTAE